MNYKKITRDNYTLHLIETSRFKSVDLSIYFTKKYKKKNRVLYNMLTKNMVYSCKKYKTNALLNERTEELYGVSIGSSYNVIGSIENFILHTNYLNPEYTSSKYYKDTIDLFFEVLFNPNVSNNGFDEKIYEITKNDLKATINGKKDSSNRYASIEFNKLMYKGLPASNDSVPTLKELDSISPKDLYEFYKTLFDGSYKIDVVILGENIEKDLDYIENKLNKFKGNNKKLSNIVKTKYTNNVIEKIDTLHFNQSKLYMGYKLDKLNDFELRYVMRVYNTILGTMNDSLLFSEVREKNSLCYNIGSYYSRINKSLVIYSGINKDNYEITTQLIEKCIKDMSNYNIVNMHLNAAVKTINTYLNNYYDDAFSQWNTRYMSEFDKDEDIETIRNIINNITVEEIINISKKITLSVKYLLKGDN